jgi:hypothetical protein
MADRPCRLQLIAGAAAFRQPPPFIRSNRLTTDRSCARWIHCRRLQQPHVQVDYQKPGAD